MLKTSGFLFLVLVLSYCMLPVRLAHACAVPQPGPMPVCGRVSIDDGLDIVIIDSRARDTRSNILIGPRKVSAGFIDVHVKPTERRLAVILSHIRPMVIRFSGATDSVKQVIALGSRLGGWDHVAVTGIEKQKLNFVPTIGLSKKLYTSCGRPPQSCVPVQFFKGKWVGPRTYPIDKSRRRISVDDHYIITRGSSISIPRAPGVVGRKPASWRPKRGKHILNYPQTRDWRYQLARYRAKFGAPIAQLDADKLVSPALLAVDENPPSWEGIAKLVKEKKIRAPRGYDEDEDLISFSKRVSHRFRSRLDPNFSFRPPIDLVLEHSDQSTLMPKNLRSLSLSGGSVVFLAKGRLPRESEGIEGRYCFFFLNEHYDRKYASHRRRCNRFDFPRGPIWGYRWSENAKTEKILMAATSTGYRPRPCSLVEVPEGVKVVALATAAGRDTADAGSLVRRFCQATSSDSAGRACSLGQVNVEVNTPGRTFMVLNSTSAADWRFKVAEHSEIVGVVTVSNVQQKFSGLPATTKVQHIVPQDRSLPENCRHALLRADPLVGGPAVQLFDNMFSWISGRSIDRLISKGPPPPKEKRTPENIAQYTKFIVD